VLVLTIADPRVGPMNFQALQEIWSPVLKKPKNRNIEKKNFEKF
jgi:hypothetical protein